MQDERTLNSSTQVNEKLVNKSLIYIKALCIMAIVGEACNISPTANHITHLLIPSLFITLGYCFKTESWNNGLSYVNHRIYNNYLPFVICAVVFTSLHNLFALVNLTTGIYGWQETFQSIWNIGMGMCDYDPILCASYWIFRAMLVCSIGFFLISLILRKKFEQLSQQMVILYATLIITVMLIWMALSDLTVPFICQGGYIEFTCIVLFGIGALYRQYEVFLSGKIWIIVIMTLIVVATIVLCPNTIIIEQSILNILHTVVCGTAVFFILHYISNILATSNNFFTHSLRYIGDNWIYIIIFFPLIFKIIGIFHVLFSTYDWAQLPYLPMASNTFNVMSLIYWVCGVSIPILCVWAWRKADEKYNLTPKNCLKYFVDFLIQVGKLLWKFTKWLGRSIWKSIKNFFMNISDIIKASNPKDE